MKAVTVLDLGSSSTRAMQFDPQAQLISPIARERVDFHVSADGASEDDPHAAVARARAALVALDHPIAQLAISSYAGSLVCLDEQGEPITPIITYADTRAADDAATLRAAHDEMGVLQRTGCRVRANYAPARLAWLRRTRPEIFACTRWFVSLADYVAQQLYGRPGESPRTGVSVAAWNGLLNRESGDWDAAWLEVLGIRREQMPLLAEPGGFVAPAIGDGACANVGSGCVDDARIAVTIGSTAALRLITRRTARDQPGPLPAALWAYRARRDLDLIGGATTEGGNVHAWLAQSLRLPDAADVDAELAAARPDGHGLTVLPLFGGERSPGFADRARATIHGLSFDTRPIDILRASLEAVALRLSLIYAALSDYLGGRRPELVASGGALLGSPAWCQIIADACDARLTVCAEPEATARGAAMLALDRLDLAARLGAVYEPDPGRHALYAAARDRQQALYGLLVSAASGAA